MSEISRKIQRCPRIQFNIGSPVRHEYVLWNGYLKKWEKQKPRCSSGFNLDLYNRFVEGAEPRRVTFNGGVFSAVIYTPSGTAPSRENSVAVATDDQGNQVVLGWITEDRTVRNFVKWNTLECITLNENNEHPFISFIKSICEPVLEKWEPLELADAVYKRMSSLKSTRKKEIENRIERIMRQIDRYSHYVDEHLKEVRAERMALASIDSFKIEQIREEMKGYEEYILSASRQMYVTDDELVVIMEPFLIQDVELGPLRVVMRLNDCKVLVYPEDGASTSSGHCHPHVNSNGAICWGNAHATAVSLRKGFKPAQLLATLIKMLREGYDPGSAYSTIAQWQGRKGWWCSVCRCRHDDGQHCPRSNQVVQNKSEHTNRITFQSS